MAAAAETLQQRIATADRLLEAGSTDEAVAEYRRALTLASGATNAQILDQLSAIETDTGDYDAAARDANAAASLYAELGDTASRVSSLNQAGLAQMYAGAYATARETLGRTLAIALNANLHEAIVELRMNVASVEFYTGHYAGAATQYELAARVIAAHPQEDWTRRRRRVLLANRATLDQRLGRYDEALASYKEALSDTRDVRADEHAQMLANLGVVYRRLGDPYKALAAYDEARAIFAKEEFLDGELGVLKNRGIVLALDLHRFDEALATFADAYRRASEAGNAREALQAQLYGAETLLRLGDVTAAARDFAAASQTARQLETIEDQWKALYGLARCDLARGDDASATTHLRESIAVIEKIRDAIRIPSLKSDFFNDKREVFDALIALRLRQSASVTEIFDLVERGHSRGWRERVGLRSNIDLPSIQRALPGDAVLLDYWTSNAGAAVLVITRTSALVQRITVDAARIRALVDSLARGPSSNWKSLATKIHAELLPAIDAKTPHVLIVTDGALASLPFELLGQPVLIEQHDVTYIPTAAMLLRETKPVRAWAMPWSSQFRGFADPVFGSAPLDDPAEMRNRLVASADEVRAIAKELGGRALLHVGEEDRKQYLANASQTPLVHIASHAFVDPGAIEQSRILFSAERRGGVASYLFLKEAYELPFDDVELAVLSACDTERGRVTAGEGIESFSRAFLAAGAKTTVTTLWRVPDATTASFMRIFYHHLQRGESRAEALRLAKLRFMDNGRDPHEWAAFVLTGDGLRAIPTALRWSTILIALGIVLLVAIVGLSLLRRRSS